MEHTNIEKYGILHKEIMNRLSEGELTVEQAKDTIDLAFNKYLGNYDSELAMMAIESVIKESETDYELLKDFYLENGEEGVEKDTGKLKAIINKIVDGIKEFFKKIYEFIKSAIKKLKGEVTEVYTKHQLRELMEDFQDKVENAEKRGVQHFKFIDIDALYKCFEEENVAYSKILMDFASKRFFINLTQNDLDKLPKEVDEIREKYEKKLLEILNNKKEYSIREARLLYTALEQLRFERMQGITDPIDDMDELVHAVEDLLIDAAEGKFDKDVEMHQKTMEKIAAAKQTITKVSSNTVNHARKIAIGIASACGVVSTIFITKKVLDFVD